MIDTAMTQREFEAMLEATLQRVEHLVALHMDLQLRVRFSPADVARSVIVEAAHQQDEYIADGRPIAVWLRELALCHIDDLRQVHMPGDTKLPVTVLPISDYWQHLLPYRESGMVVTNWAGYRIPYLKQRIRIAMESLDPSDQELLTLAHCEQLDPFEIASVLGISSRSVKTRCRCAILQFQKMFQLTRRRTGALSPGIASSVHA
jgi:DNA-directed RNA polymerase specialized sigma24 family protein